MSDLCGVCYVVWLWGIAVVDVLHMTWALWCSVKGVLCVVVFRVYAPKCAACGQAITLVDVSRSADTNKSHATQAKQPKQRTKKGFMYRSMDCTFTVKCVAYTVWVSLPCKDHLFHERSETLLRAVFVMRCNYCDCIQCLIIFTEVKNWPPGSPTSQLEVSVFDWRHALPQDIFSWIFSAWFGCWLVWYHIFPPEKWQRELNFGLVIDVEESLNFLSTLCETRT